jgi:hypothetical protein
MTSGAVYNARGSVRRRGLKETIPLAAAPVGNRGNESRRPEGRLHDQVRPEILPAKSVGVQAPPVYLHAQQFF